VKAINPASLVSFHFATKMARADELSHLLTCTQQPFADGLLTSKTEIGIVFLTLMTFVLDPTMDCF